MSECRSEIVKFPMGDAGTGTYVAYRTIEDHDGDGLSTYTYRVALGGKRGGAACVSLVGEVDRRDHRREVRLHLDGLRYYKGCAARPGLVKGQSASMAKAALKRASTLVPNVTAVTLQDESYRVTFRMAAHFPTFVLERMRPPPGGAGCSLPHPLSNELPEVLLSFGKSPYNLCGYAESTLIREGRDDMLQRLLEISLADHNMMLHGGTWYMRKLGAMPASERCARTIDAWRVHISSTAPSDAEELETELQDVARETAMMQREIGTVVALAFGAGLERPSTWSDVYRRVDAGACPLFGKLSAFARAKHGAPSLRSEMFVIPREVIDAWPAPFSVEDLGLCEADSGQGGGGLGKLSAAAHARRLVDATFRTFGVARLVASMK